MGEPTNTAGSSATPAEPSSSHQSILPLSVDGPQEDDELESQVSPSTEVSVIEPPSRESPQPLYMRIAVSTCDSLNRFRRRWRPQSLAWSSVTPLLVSVLIPVLSVVTHVIFLYGQTYPMWRLHVSEHVDTWINGTSLQARAALDTLGLPHDNHIYVSKDYDVKQFDYMYAIHELWKAKHMPGKVLPRTAAVLLVVFSGIWPHLKLLLLNMTWLFTPRNSRRTRTLHWLSTLGKWSLADVLVVCVMVGVLHLDWVVDPLATKHGLVENLPFALTVMQSLYSATDICDLALKLDCHTQQHSWKNWSKCKACVALVKSAYDHPETARETFGSVIDGVQVSGDGLVYLRVMGMSGIYAFCTAVILSILLSVVVDLQDVRDNMQQNSLEDEEEDTTESPKPLPPPKEVIPFPDNEDGALHDLLLSNEGHDARASEPHELAANVPLEQDLEPRMRKINSGNGNWKYRYKLLGACLVTVVLVVCAVSCHTIERTVHGAIPKLLGDVLGVAWNRYYSLVTLVKTTGAAGGQDLLLMGVFALFVVVGPVVRALMCLVAWMLPTSGRYVRSWLSAIDFIGAFCAWEVFAVAVLMVDLLMPAITSTVIMNPQCAQVSEDGSCLRVNFDLQWMFLLVIFGGCATVGLSKSAFGWRNMPSSTDSSGHRASYTLVSDAQTESAGSESHPYTLLSDTQIESGEIV